MTTHYRSQGFVLKKTDLREADQVFTIYSEDFGKLEILGRAIRKIKSKLRSGAELFYLSEIEFIQGKTYKTLTDAITIKKFKNIRQDLEKLEIAYQIAETADELIKGEEQDQEIWNLLNEVFKKLEIVCPVGSAKADSFGENCKLEIIYHYFIWNLLSILGYQIDLYHCVICQEKLKPEKFYFSPEKGGIICLRCSDDSIRDKLDISPETVKILRILLKKDWDTLVKLKIADSCRDSLESVSENYLSYLKS